MMRWKPNTTVAAIAEQQGRFLLVEESVHGQVVFNQPAGHLEYGETLLEAVQREVLEETAWRFQPRSLVGIYLYPNEMQTNSTYLRFCFYGLCTQQIDQQLDQDILSAEWLSLADIERKKNKMRSPLVLRCIYDYLNGSAYPLTLLRDIHCG